LNPKPQEVIRSIKRIRFEPSLQ